MSVYDQLITEFHHRKCAHADIYPGHYACSLGAHIFNLVNQETEVLVANAIPVDTRLHTMFVAPPGFWCIKGAGQEIPATGFTPRGPAGWVREPRGSAGLDTAPPKRHGGPEHDAAGAAGNSPAWARTHEDHDGNPRRPARPQT